MSEVPLSTLAAASWPAGANLIVTFSPCCRNSPSICATYSPVKSMVGETSTETSAFSGAGAEFAVAAAEHPPASPETASAHATPSAADQRQPGNLTATPDRLQDQLRGTPGFRTTMPCRGKERVPPSRTEHEQSIVNALRRHHREGLLV